MFLTRNIIIASLLLFPVAALALPTDSEQPLKIVSDSSVYDYKTGVKIYEGNVQVDQGSTHLSADKVTTKNNAKHQIDEATAYGEKKLAEYTTTPKEGDTLFRAKAKIIKFNPETMVVTLEGNVVVTQGENSFHGPLIVYNMKEQTVNAPASKSGRATVVIEPKHLKL
jgi:lipopolysaccharide export system protein LptA